MQRRERNVPLEVSKHVLIDQNRPVVVRTAMDHPVADRNRIDILGFAQPLRRHGNRGRNIGDVVSTIVPIDEQSAVACLCAQVWARTNSIDLSLEQAAKLLRT